MNFALKYSMSANTQHFQFYTIKYLLSTYIAKCMLWPASYIKNFSELQSYKVATTKRLTCTDLTLQFQVLIKAVTV